MSWTEGDTLARTIPFRELLHAAATDAGMDPEELDTSTARQLTRGINAAYRFAWEYYDWPESSVVEELACDPHPRHGGRFVPRQTAAGLRIATLFGFWTADPLTDREACAVRWLTGPDGYYPQDHDPLTIWAEYRTDAVQFDSRDWDSTKIYRAGSLCYQLEDGHCYRGTVGTQGVIPGVTGQAGVLHAATPTQPAYYEATEDGVTPIPDDAWTVQPVLWILAEAVTVGACSMYARTEGQYGAAGALDGIMAVQLDAQILQIDNQSGDSKPYRRTGRW